jgi:hypothetical protein
MATNIDLSKRNIPLDIENEPIVWTTMADGKRYVAPPMERQPCATVPTKVPVPVIVAVPQAETTPRWDGYQGIKLYASRALFRANLEILARGLEILHDADLMGKKGVSKKDIEDCALPVLGASGVRGLWDVLNGRAPNRHETKGEYDRDAFQNRDRFMELLVSFSPSYNNKYLREEKTHQKIGRGRPSSYVNIPSEKELTQLLLNSGLIEKADVNDQNVLKQHSDLKSKAAYRAKIGVGEHVKRNGEGQYTRRELADLTGCSLPTVRRDAVKVLGMRVDTMPKNRKPYPAKYRDSLPVDHIAKEKQEALGNIPFGVHFETSLGDEQFEYTQAGWDACKATGTKCVMECTYVSSKYYPSEKVTLIE